jgi:UrcA family protein
MKTSVRILAGIIAATGISVLAAPAMAWQTAQSGKDQVMRKETVSYRDLNVADKVGAERLYERIALAADNVCGMNDEGVALLFDRDYLACKDKAIADAVAKVDQPKLTAIMDQRISSQELAEAESRVARS